MKERLEMLPKKETGEVNHNTQYLTQHMNTDRLLNSNVQGMVTGSNPRMNLHSVL